jgi:glucosamine-6-phosphate deaminase
MTKEFGQDHPEKGSRQMAKNGVKPVATRAADQLQVKIYETRQDMGAAAGQAVANKMRSLLASQDRVSMVFAAAPSQNEFLDALTAAEGIDWSRVTAFHLDEYIGLPAGAPQRFAKYLEDHLFGRVTFGKIHLIDVTAESEAECERYTALLKANPLDIACVGIGENGHLAFNDPPVADFSDPKTVKVVELDQVCRQQQVNDGCFPHIDAVPTHALTMTVPAIMEAKEIHCIVPGPTKAEAVERTINGPIATSCPASIMRKHASATLYIDRAAGAKIL